MMAHIMCTLQLYPTKSHASDFPHPKQKKVIFFSLSKDMDKRILEIYNINF